MALGGVGIGGGGRLLASDQQHNTSVFSDWLSNTMPELDRSLFTGDSNPPDDIGKFEVANLGTRVDGILKKTGWSSTAHGCIGLYLSPDHLRVINGQFFMRGALEERDVKMSAM